MYSMNSNISIAYFSIAPLVGSTLFFNYSSRRLYVGTVIFQLLVSICPTTTGQEPPEAFFDGSGGIIKKEEKREKDKERKRKAKEEKREKEKEGKEKEGVNREVPQLNPILTMLSVRGVLDGIAAGNAVGEFLGLSGDAVGI
jgi:hypothetical protein